MTQQQDENIFAHLVARRRGTDDHRPILTFDNGEQGVETRTYSELFDNANKLAAFLIRQGMRKGDRFAVLLQNHPETVEALIAASISACVAVPIDPRAKGEKLLFMLRHTDCRGVICAGYNLAQLTGLSRDLQLSWVLVVEAVSSEIASATSGIAQPYTTLSGESSEPVTVRCQTGEEALQILYTSGTTGDPKGIVKSNAHLAFAGQLVSQAFGITQRDTLYTGLSLTHTNAQVLMLAPALISGVPAVFSRKFTKSRLWDVMRKYHCTVFSLLGGMTTAIYSEPERPEDTDNPVRLVISAGMPVAIWRAFEKRFNVRLNEGFGTAEGGFFWNDGSGPVGSCGNLNDNPVHEARIVDEAGNSCPPGVAGELIWRNRSGAPVVVEYFNNPEASAKKTENGWLRTGDVLHADEAGWMFFDYRKGGGIRHNGDFVEPGFIEKIIAECKMVDDVFVYGIPATSQAPGEKDVVAAIVPKDPITFDSQPVFCACRDALEPNFVPDYLQIVDEIPKTVSEKPQERFLIERFSTADAWVFSRRDWTAMTPPG